MYKGNIKLCIANRKGGVSKTTTAVNMSSILAEEGYKVLLIDLDPQGNASENLGLILAELQNTIYEVIAEKILIKKAIHKTNYGIDIIPANIDLAEAEIEIANKINREKILDNLIKESNIEKEYNFIIFDLPPNLGLLSINGLVATDKVIVPVDVGLFSLSGISDLISLIGLIKKSQLNSDLDIMGVVMTKVDNRTNASKDIKILLENSLGNMVFQTQIRQNIKIVESQINNQPINFYDKTSSGYIEYLEFVKEVLKYVK